MLVNCPAPVVLLLSVGSPPLKPRCLSWGPGKKQKCSAYNMLGKGKMVVVGTPKPMVEQPGKSRFLRVRIVYISAGAFPLLVDPITKVTMERVESIFPLKAPKWLKCLPLIYVRSILRELIPPKWEQLLPLGMATVAICFLWFIIEVAKDQAALVTSFLRSRCVVSCLCLAF